MANAQALHDLENGASGLTLVFAGANGAHGFGLEPTAEAIDKVLDGIFIDAGIAIELQIGPQSRMAAIHVAEYVKRKGVRSRGLRHPLRPRSDRRLRGLGIEPLRLAGDRARRHRRRSKGFAGDGLQGSVRARRWTGDP